MSTKPRPHDDALLPMTEEEERRLHKKAIMDKKDLLDYSLYLFDAGFLKWFFNDPNAFNGFLMILMHLADPDGSESCHGKLKN